MTMNDDLDMISFEIIADAGDARRFAAKAWTTRDLDTGQSE